MLCKDLTLTFAWCEIGATSQSAYSPLHLQGLKVFFGGHFGDLSKTPFRTFFPTTKSSFWHIFPNWCMYSFQMAKPFLYRPARLEKKNLQKMVVQNEGERWGEFLQPRFCSFTLRVQVCPKEGITPIHSYFKDGIATLNPIRSGGVWI